MYPSPPIRNNHKNFPFSRGIEFIIVEGFKQIKKIATIDQRKNTITMGDISPDESRPAMVLPAHPSIQKISRR